MTNDLANVTPAPKPVDVINPFTIADTVAKVDEIIDELVHTAVMQIDNEARRTIRQREMTVAMRGVLHLREALERSLDASPEMADVTRLMIDGCAEELTALLKTINPAATTERIVEIVTATLDSFKARIPELAQVPVGKPERVARKRRSE